MPQTSQFRLRKKVAYIFGRICLTSFVYCAKSLVYPRFTQTWLFTQGHDFASSLQSANNVLARSCTLDIAVGQALVSVKPISDDI